MPTSYRYLLLPARPALLALQHGPPPPDPPPPPPAPPRLARTAPPPGAWAAPWHGGRAWANAAKRLKAPIGRWAKAGPRWAVVLTLALPVLGYAVLVLAGAALATLLALPWLGWARLRGGPPAARHRWERLNAWLLLGLMGEWREEQLYPDLDPDSTPEAQPATAAEWQAHHDALFAAATRAEAEPPTDTPAQVAATLAAARELGYRVAVYGLPAATAADHAAGAALVADGRADAYWPDFDPATWPARLADAHLHRPDSLLLLHSTAQLAAAAALGFVPEPAAYGPGRCMVWGQFASSYQRHDHLRAESIERIRYYHLHHQRLGRHTAGLPEDLVVYLADDAPQPLIEEFLAAQEPRIVAALAAKGLRWLYVPAARPVGAALGEQPLAPLLRQFPALRAVPPATLHAELAALGRALDGRTLSRALLADAGLSHFERPALLRRAGAYSTGPHSFRVRSFRPPAHLPAAGQRAWLEERLTQYLANVGGREQGPLFSLNPGPDDYHADWRFHLDGQTLPPDLVARLAILEAQPDGAAALAQVLLHVAGQLHALRPDLLPTLSARLAPPAAVADSARPRSAYLFTPNPPTAAPAELSPLHITPDLRLLLPAYADTEIELSPLPRALYLFFLTQPPEGLMFHDLPDHRAALLALYQRLQPGLEADTARARIAELCDVRLNSVNEKCSRIKAAFVAALPERLASFYYVAGQRGGCKGVALPRELVRWEGPS